MKKNEINQHFNIIILGGGAGGIFAATTASFFGYSVCLIEQNGFLGGQIAQLYPNKYVYDFPGKIKATAKSILDELIEQVKSSDAIIKENTKVIEIHKEEQKFIVTTNNNQCLSTNYLIVASGIGSFAPNVLKIQDKEIIKKNIIYNVDLDETIYKNKKIVVLGGGDSALDWCNHFVESKISKDVTIIHRKNEYRSGNIGVLKLKKNKVKEYLNYEITKVGNKSITIKHNETKKNLIIDYDLILVQYGQIISKNEISFLDQIEKNEIKKILVDQNQRTNIENVYAIGDCTFYNNKPNTIVTAAADGTRAIWDIYKNNKKNNQYN